LDRKNATDQAYCDETITTLTNQINSGENSIATLSKAISDNQEILSSAQTSLDQASSDYDETVKSIEVNREEREAQHEKWAASDAELTDTIIVIDEATKLI
jgi:predicted  nucleic acid-binding Zn-ribbon protein